MKVAVCFSGLVGSTKGKSHKRIGNAKKCFEISSKLYKKHILDKNDVDVFVHSWSTDLSKEIVDMYEPKKHIIENQIVFDTPKYPILNNTTEPRKQTHYSLQYSRMIATQLKADYEKEQGFKYDCVMLARFDLAWQSDLIFSDYDQDYIWAAMWPKKFLNGRMLKDVEYWKLVDSGVEMENRWYGYPYDQNGLLGTWFFSNSELIDKFTTLYKLDEYSLPGRCPLDSNGCMSAHQQSLYHLSELGALHKLRFTEKNWHDDCPTVRRKYFKEK